MSYATRSSIFAVMPALGLMIGMVLGMALLGDSPYSPRTAGQVAEIVETVGRPLLLIEYDNFARTRQAWEQSPECQKALELLKAWPNPTEDQAWEQLRARTSCRVVLAATYSEGASR